MSTTAQGGSAKIYQFPARGRFVINAPPNDSNHTFAALRVPKISDGSWYHEEAIEAERARKN